MNNWMAAGIAVMDIWVLTVTKDDIATVLAAVSLFIMFGLSFKGLNKNGK